MYLQQCLLLSLMWLIVAGEAEIKDKPNSFLPPVRPLPCHSVTMIKDVRPTEFLFLAPGNSGDCSFIFEGTEGSRLAIKVRNLKSNLPRGNGDPCEDGQVRLYNYKGSGQVNLAQRLCDNEKEASMLTDSNMAIVASSLIDGSFSVVARAIKQTDLLDSKDTDQFLSPPDTKPHKWNMKPITVEGEIKITENKEDVKQEIEDNEMSDENNAEEDDAIVIDNEPSAVDNIDGSMNDINIKEPSTFVTPPEIGSFEANYLLDAVDPGNMTDNMNDTKNCTSDPYDYYDCSNSTDKNYTGYHYPKPIYHAPYEPKPIYAPPTYEPPKPVYHAPKPEYKPPDHQYTAPGHTYTSPGSTYSAPGNTYSAPGGTYSAPGSTYSAPGSTYSAPGGTYSAPGSTYSAPGGTYSAPGNTYTAPGNTYTAPGNSYSAPGHSYAPPKPEYKPPEHSYGAPKPIYTPPVEYSPVYEKPFRPSQPIPNNYWQGYQSNQHYDSPIWYDDKGPYPGKPTKHVDLTHDFYPMYPSYYNPGYYYPNNTNTSTSTETPTTTTPENTKMTTINKPSTSKGTTKNVPTTKPTTKKPITQKPTTHATTKKPKIVISSTKDHHEALGIPLPWTVNVTLTSNDNLVNSVEQEKEVTTTESTESARIKINRIIHNLQKINKQK